MVGIYYTTPPSGAGSFTPKRAEPGAVSGKSSIYRHFRLLPIRSVHVCSRRFIGQSLVGEDRALPPEGCCVIGLVMFDRRPQIGDWLDQLGMAEYAQLFAENDVDL
jgi:hypothetical protein